MRENYFRHGIKVWWLDAIEPEMVAYDHDNVRYHAGNGLEVGCIYPLMQQQAFYEGMKSAGEKDVVTLGRAGFAGSQRYGAAIWSGDIHSTWEDLQQQVRAGLNIGLSGTLTAGGGKMGLILDVGGYYKNVFTIAPSLYITEKEIDTAIELFEEALKRGIAETE